MFESNDFTILLSHKIVLIAHLDNVVESTRWKKSHGRSKNFSILRWTNEELQHVANNRHFICTISRMECIPKLRGNNKLLRFEITQNFELTAYWEHNQDIFLSLCVCWMIPCYSVYLQRHTNFEHISLSFYILQIDQSKNRRRTTRVGA